MIPNEIRPKFMARSRGSREQGMGSISWLDPVCLALAAPMDVSAFIDPIQVPEHERREAKSGEGGLNQIYADDHR